eukprot:2381910-Lingulodinium_polyedra.AAC.1
MDPGPPAARATGPCTPGSDNRKRPRPLAGGRAPLGPPAKANRRGRSQCRTAARSLQGLSGTPPNACDQTGSPACRRGHRPGGGGWQS